MAGPFIGPRGGKWADSGHTVPWREKSPDVEHDPRFKKSEHHSAERLILNLEKSAGLSLGGGRPQFVLGGQVRVPGQVPGRTPPMGARARLDPELDRTLSRRPQQWSLERHLDRPPVTVRDVTAGLGLSKAMESRLSGIVARELVSTRNRVELAKSIIGVLLQEVVDPEVRVIVSRRALQLYGSVVRKSGYAEVYLPEELLELRKAGPFIGPRGGKWRDPRHTVPWRGAVAKPSAPRRADAMARAWSDHPVGRRTGATYRRVARALNRRDERALVELADAAFPSMRSKVARRVGDVEPDEFRELYAEEAWDRFTDVIDREVDHAAADLHHAAVEAHVEAAYRAALAAGRSEAEADDLQDTLRARLQKGHSPGGMRKSASRPAVKYVAKVERAGRTRYFYDEDQYRRAHGRHISNEEGTKAVIGRDALRCVARAGKAGCDIGGFRDLVKKYGATSVHAAVRAGLDSGDLKYEKNRFFPSSGGGDRKK